MDDAKLRSTILASAADLATALLHDDRKDDEELPRGAIEDALDAEATDVGEILDAFARELGVQLGLDIKLDVVFGAKHRYFSTHCRHGRHEDCSATSLAGPDAEEPRILHAIERKPAQCKRCGSPCICPACKASGRH